MSPSEEPFSHQKDAPKKNIDSQIQAGRQIAKENKIYTELLRKIQKLEGSNQSKDNWPF